MPISSQWTLTTEIINLKNNVDVLVIEETDSPSVD
jgi:hypothetical protein